MTRSLVLGLFVCLFAISIATAQSQNKVQKSTVVRSDTVVRGKAVNTWSSDGSNQFYIMTPTDSSRSGKTSKSKMKSEKKVIVPGQGQLFIPDSTKKVIRFR